jgi:hypothetical protein
MFRCWLLLDGSSLEETATFASGGVDRARGEIALSLQLLRGAEKYCDQRFKFYKIISFILMY